MKRLYADFNDFAADGTLPLTSKGSVDSIDAPSSLTMTPLAYQQRCTRLDETRDGGGHARAWVWAARFSTPVWRRIPLGARDVLLAAGDEVRLAEPVDVSVEYVDRSRFHPLSVPFAQAWELLASVDEPSVIFVDANGSVLALITDEHALLLLRGHISDWPTDA